MTRHALILTFALMASVEGAAAQAPIVSGDQVIVTLDASPVLMPVVVIDSVNRTPSPNSPDADKAFPPLPTEFEVADVKPSDPDDQGNSRYSLGDSGRFTVRDATLKSLIAFQRWPAQHRSHRGLVVGMDVRLEPGAARPVRAGDEGLCRQRP